MQIKVAILKPEEYQKRWPIPHIPLRCNKGSGISQPLYWLKNSLSFEQADRLLPKHIIKADKGNVLTLSFILFAHDAAL